MTSTSFDVERIRKDFPVLSRELPGGRPLVYLDSGNSSQKPTQVIETMREHLAMHYSNVGRAMHALGRGVDRGVRERARQGRRVRRRPVARRGDLHQERLRGAQPGRLLLRQPGQHRSRASRSAPVTRSSSPRWSTTPTSCRGRCSCSAPARRCKWFGVTDEGRLDLSGLPELVTERTKIVSIAHQSNVLGTVNPVAEVLARAREVGALVMLDASQSVPHHPVDVAELGVDFVAFTGHKMVGPSGIGVLWGRGELLEAMPPFLGGGEMIEAVWMDHSTYAPVPHKFEAGTPPIVEAIGLGAAVDYLTGIGMDADRGARAGADGLRAGRPARGARAAPHRPATRSTCAAARCRSRWRASTRTTSGRSSTTGSASRCASGTTARARCTCGSEYRRPPGRRSTCTTPRREIDALVRGLHHVQKVFA